MNLLYTEPQNLWEGHLGNVEQTGSPQFVLSLGFPRVVLGDVRP